MTVNEDFSDEIEAINAIFGDGTCQIISANRERTRVKLKLPSIPHDYFDSNSINKVKGTTSLFPKQTLIYTDLSFFAEFPIAYPQVTPRVNCLDGPLFDYYDRTLWKVQLALQMFLKEVFTPGEVCIYDWFLRCSPAIDYLSCGGLGWTRSAKLTSDFTVNKNWLRWALRQKPLNFDQALERWGCTICLDDFKAYEMINMDCGHMFCIDCFHEGWDVSLENQEPYECCSRRIPLDWIRVFVQISEAQAKKYERVLLIRDTPMPVFCPREYCSTFLGSALKYIRRGRKTAHCSECKMYFCIDCRGVAHGGDCNLGDFASAMEDFDIRRCPGCGQATEKDGGCSTMRCRRCGASYTWQSDGGIVPWH